MSKLIISFLPGLDNCLVTFFLGCKTTLMLYGNMFNLLLRIRKDLLLLRRNGHIRNGNRHGRTCGELISESLYGIKCFGCLCCAVNIDTLFKDLLQLLLTYKGIYFEEKKIFFLVGISLAKTKVLRNDLVENEGTERCLDDP